MPRKYQKGKSNRSVKNTSIWSLVKKGQFASIDVDMRTLKSFHKLKARFKTNPNYPNKINVSEKKESLEQAYQENEIVAYNRKKQQERELELQKKREEEQRKKNEREKEIEKIKKGFGKPQSNYDESKYIYWCNPFGSINQGKLGPSRIIRKKDKRYYY